MTIDFEDIKAAILDFVAKKFPLEKYSNGHSSNLLLIQYPL